MSSAADARPLTVALLGGGTVGIGRPTPARERQDLEDGWGRLSS